MPSSQGLVDKNSANNTHGRHIRNYSTFSDSLSYPAYNTHRYGEYVPTFVMDGVPSDEITLNSSDKIDSLSLKAPFQGSVRKIKESFMVPNMAILPLQWDRIYAQNSNGDDVPTDCNCIYTNFPARFRNLWQGCFATTIALPITTSAEAATFLTSLIRTMVLGEFVYSTGCLLNVLGYKASTQLSVYRYDSQASRLYTTNYDIWFDEVISLLFDDISSFEVIEPVGSGTVLHRYNGGDGATLNSTFDGYEDFRSMLELFRENPLCYFNSNITFGSSTLSAWATAISAEISGSYSLLNSNSFVFHVPVSNSDVDPSGSHSDVTALNPATLNLTRLLSYQLVCAHFYSNSSVDFIYSAELYRQYINQLTRKIITTSSFATNSVFSWNGMNLSYDYLSGHLLSYALNLVSSATAYQDYLTSSISKNTSNGLASLAVWSAIFGFRKSLRYGDYFTSSRPRPLAPINTDVSVQSNSVSVIDITRNIQAQRFANAVMRSRSKIEEYVKSLFGKAPQPDYHNPFFLTRSEEIIFGDQVQSTAQNLNPQYANSRTANFAGNLGRYTFTFHNDDMHPCTYLQIVSYDSPRCYTRSVDRSFLHIDRFDMFNPDFQFIGDQAVYGIELGYYSTTGIQDIFGYQSRDMEYKQRFPVASGGYASGALPGWAFTDNRLASYNMTVISPDFIRSRNTDIDNLYLGLTGFSLGTYFHFTCKTNNYVNAKRAMAVDPQILA